MRTEQVQLIEMKYNPSFFKGTLLDLLREVYEAGQESKESPFDKTKYFNIAFESITFED